MKKLPVLAALSMVIVPATSFAAVVATHSHVLQAYETTFTPSSTDLINSGQSTAGAVTTTYAPLNANYGQIGVLTDGVATGNDSTRVLPSGLVGFTVTYDLNTTTNPLGYDISQILSYAGNPDGRARQEYQVFYSLVGDSSYIQLIPDTYTSDRTTTMPFQTNTGTGGGQVAGGSGGETQLTINVQGLTNVDSIRFVTQPASGNSVANGASVYREFDVIGTASVIPEPTVAGLMGMVGLFGLVRRRR